MISLLLSCVLWTWSVTAQPPNIVMMVVDDMGWADVPWNNPESPAVNMGHYARYVKDGDIQH